MIAARDSWPETKEVEGVAAMARLAAAGADDAGAAETDEEAGFTGWASGA